MFYKNRENKRVYAREDRYKTYNTDTHLTFLRTLSKMLRVWVARHKHARQCSQKTTISLLIKLFHAIHKRKVGEADSQMSTPNPLPPRSPLPVQSEEKGGVCRWEEEWRQDSQQGPVITLLLVYTRPHSLLTVLFSLVRCLSPPSSLFHRHASILPLPSLIVTSPPSILTLASLLLHLWPYLETPYSSKLHPTSSYLQHRITFLLPPHSSILISPFVTIKKGSHIA